MSETLLSSLVQTKSIELVLAPIAAQVSQLILLNEVSQRDGIPLPDMVPDAQQIRQAVNGLVLAAQRLVVEVPDDDLRSGMPLACEAVKDAGNCLLLATHQLKEQPFSHKVRYNLVDSARNILEGTMKVLLVYDQAEIRKIVASARWVMDQLHLVERATSSGELVVKFQV
ncbi:vinculin-like [Montipora foliosa]|uniref:vinculin-like n=1 Tax=Montipora foliosa TaxID=591990 RepID=UPI0035F110D5